MSHFTGITVLLSALLLSGCAGFTQTNTPTPMPTEFGAEQQAGVVMTTDMGAAEQFCIDQLGKDTPARADCYDYAKGVCFSADDTFHPQEPLRGDCTRRWESYGFATPSG